MKAKIIFIIALLIATSLLYLFGIFNKIGVYHFWMKDMNFPIDIIWIGEDYKIVYIKENALPESYPEKFNPNQPALYVLEINAGMVSENEIKIEDFVFLE